MTDEQFDRLLEALSQQKRILASIGFYMNAQFWALVILAGISLISLIVLLVQ